MRKNAKRIGLAIVGAGRVGLFRGEVAARHPMVDFIGIADLKEERLELVQKKTRADFATTDFNELLKRPEVTAAIISTDEHLHVEPILAALERGLPLLIEKPLATELAESARVLAAIERSGVDAVVGYTQRFRRRFLVAKEKVRTGQLGDVMKESASIALSYLRANADALGLDADDLQRRFHVHVPAGAIPKDGPSAGITMATALASLLSGRPVKHTVGMTGELTLQGRVLPIGGLKQKVLAAHAAGLTDVVIPERNRADLDDVPEHVREELTFHPVMSLDEVLDIALEPAKSSRPHVAA